MRRGGSWKKGQAPKSPGRPKGKPHPATIEGRELARGVLQSPEYLASFTERLISGRYPQLDRLAWEYGFGKPKEQVEISGPGGAALDTGARVAAYIEALAAIRISGSDRGAVHSDDASESMDTAHAAPAAGEIPEGGEP